MTRRSFLKAASTGLALLGTGGLAACDRDTSDGDNTSSATRSTKKPFEGESLRIFIYSGAWEKVFRDTFVPMFEERTGAEAILDPGWWDSIPKLKSSPPGQPAFDLVLTDATQGYPAIREGMFQTLDFDRLPNHDNYAPSVLENWVYEESYGLPHPDSVMTLAFRKDAVESPPTGWDALLDESLDGHLGMYNSFYMSLHTFAAMKVAADGRAGQAHQEMKKNLEGVLEFAREQRDRVNYWWPTSTDMVFALKQNNCRVGNMHSTDMLPALRESDELGAVVPEHDRAFVQLMWVIPSDTKKVALAHEAINMIAGDKMQRELARRGSVTPILSIAEEIASQDPIWKEIYPNTAEELRSIQYYPYEAYFEDWDGIVEAWDKTVLRKKE